MKLIKYNELLPAQKEIFFSFMKNASKETSQPAHENMWNEDWQNKNNTLPYLLEKSDRFSIHGVYNVLFDNDIVVGCSGVYTSAFCSDLAIAGTRTWIDKNYRNMSIAREYLLPAEKAWAIENNFKAIAICFNDYNKNIPKLWKRVRLGENRKTRQSHHIFFNGVNELEFPVNIQYTKQWLIYEKLKEDFDFDWSDIEWKNIEKVKSNYFLDLPSSYFN